MKPMGDSAPVSLGDNPKAAVETAPEPLPLSLLNDFLYCPRRAALKTVEGVRSGNEHTVLGELAHEHADLPGYEAGKGVTLLRALPVWSERLGLTGKCDIVEAVLSAECGMRSADLESTPLPNPALRGPHSAVPLGPPHAGSYSTLAPVEYKKGKRRAFANDDAQLCAQAMCLEEMFGQRIERGAVFHAASKRRREVEFTPELRALVERSLAELRGLIGSAPGAGQPALPRAVFKPACEECSLFEICLPKAASEGGRAERLARQLFMT
jgi:CRISPR-associated exonuclease Cas4